eukprot:1192-Chlamydomonas_euryale.AAC.1
MSTSAYVWVAATPCSLHAEGSFSAQAPHCMMRLPAARTRLLFGAERSLRFPATHTRLLLDAGASVAVVAVVAVSGSGWKVGGGRAVGAELWE